MKKVKKYQNKSLRDHRATALRNSWSREAWVEQVMKITALKYNLEDEDIENFVAGMKRKSR